ADVDGDGDLDAVVGEDYGNLNYLENTGSATAPSYVQQTGTNNPFDGINLGSVSTPTFADVDGDGDLDAVVGEDYGNLNYLENDPVVTADPAFTTDEDTSFTTGNVLTNDSDADGDTLTVDSIDTTGTLGTVTDNGDGTFNYDPNGQFESLNDGETATDTFSYTVSDGNGGTDTATVTVTINGVTDNTAPVAVDDTATTDEDVAVSIDVLDNDTDVDSDPLSIDSFTPATNGTVTLDDNGTPGDTTDDLLVYTPDSDFNGSDSFTYTTTDGTLTDTATVNITVDPVNDAPVAVDDTATTNEDTATTGNVLTNDTDVNGDILTVTEVDGVAGNVGTQITLTSGALLTLNADGSYSYDPNGQFESLNDGDKATDSFSYTISDGTLTDTATVNVTIDGLDEPLNLVGTNQKDTLIGGASNDTISGGNGADELFGGGGDDILGGKGKDKGPDILNGGTGNDTLTGGNGPDVFVFAEGDGTDTITDFSTPDVIGLTGGLSFADLSFSGSDIIVTSTSEVLATLTGVDATTLTSSDFTTV
ncbi:MAG: tandem-95 repeat protein, partial [Okeania sp. SIO1H6]|nr:tandem-95 repeat protein [Okeania sp. SIO1H6]